MDPCTGDPYPCHNGGTCIYSASSGTFACSCPPYWDGTTCLNSSHPCNVSNVTCGENAVCALDEDNDNNTVCTCQPGYEG